MKKKKSHIILLRICTAVLHALSLSLAFFSLPDEEKRLNFCFKRTTTHLVLFFPRVPLSLLYNIRKRIYNLLKQLQQVL